MNKIKLLKGRKPTKPRKPIKPKILLKSIKVPRLIQRFAKSKDPYSLGKLLDSLPPNVSVNDCYIKADGSRYYSSCELYYDEEKPNKEFSSQTTDYKKALSKYEKSIEIYDAKLIEYQKEFREWQDLRTLSGALADIKPSELKQIIEARQKAAP